jgi:two-component system, LytTR family, sensor kinase
LGSTGVQTARSDSIGNRQSSTRFDAMTSTHAVSATPRFVIVWAVIGLATVLGVVGGTEYYVNTLRAGHAVSWGEALSYELFRWYVWAGLVPGIVWIARRVRALASRWWMGVMLHALAAVGVAVVQVTLYAVFTEWISAAIGEGVVTGRLVPVFLTAKSATGIVTYLGILGGVFAFEYAERYRERAVLAADLQARLADARLEALRRQLQPHFLFNTLHAMSSLMLDGRTTDAIAMTSRLGTLLRLTLQRDRAPETTLEEELVLLDHYLDIERVRFGDRLQVDLDIDPACLPARVPVLVLQPLVENAVRHGVGVGASDGDPRHIVVRAKRDARVSCGARVRELEREGAGAGSALVLSVEDDGPGFAADARADGVGLSNTAERLRQLHGDAASLERDNRPGGGARVTIRLPLRISIAGDAGAAAPEVGVNREHAGTVTLAR